MVTVKTNRHVVVGLLSFFVLGFVFPANFVHASSDWVQSSKDDFNLDVLTNLELHYLSWDTSDAYVHLVDNDAETYSSTYTPDSEIPIDGNNLFACAFHPSFNALCDQVDLQIYVIGNPLDTNGNPAILTLTLYAATANVPHQPWYPIIYTDPNTQTQYIVGKQYAASSLPTQAGSWITLYLTETDSFRNVVEPSIVLGGNAYYTIVVVSNAIPDPQHLNEIRWKYQQNANSNDITTNYNNGNGWGLFMGPNGQQDTNIVIHWHDFVHTGNLISIVYDTGQASQFTWFDAIVRDMPAGTTPVFYVRTGNSSDTNDPSWSSWIQQTNNAQWNNICPYGQYVQYKFVITAGNDPLQTDAFTGAVKSVDITYE